MRKLLCSLCICVSAIVIGVAAPINVRQFIVPRPPPSPPVACADGVDNDLDGFIDLADPGCANSSDTDETNAPPVACADGLDNDSDGLIDLTDPGCANAADTDETNALAECADGVDNDSDGYIDLADPGCVNAADTDEVNAPPQGGTVNATSCSQAHVQAAIDASVHGNTVQIPAGSCSWTTQITITKGITLKGSGQGVTVLVDNVPKNIIGSNRLLVFNVITPYTFRLTALTIQGGVTDPNSYNMGHLRLEGTAKTFRVDHVTFATLRTVAIRIDGDLWGVIDHCSFSGNFQQGIFLSHTSWGGHNYGDGSWAEALYLGTNKAIYIETNTFTEESTQFSAGVLDALDGARFVFRYNTMIGAFMATHGTESGQRRRSVRSFEIYNNNVSLPGSKVLDRVFYLRGGTGVVYNNTISQAWNTMVFMDNFRDSGSYTPWGRCDGTSPFDQNTAGQTGWRCADQPGAGTSNLLSGLNPTPPVGNISDPIYIWGNTGGSFVYGQAAGSLHVVNNRDYFVGTARPGYTAYTYPHPLTAQ